MLRTSIVLFLVIFTISLNAQEGCTDPQANNFNPDATINDGSCLYPTTNYTLEEITLLPAELQEASGLAYFDEALWTHLDGGNVDKLFKIDTLTGAVLDEVIVANTDNLDWEDLAEDEDHIYVGDFGNNNGNRTNLMIYKIPKSEFSNSVVFPEIIEFSWSDQTDFTPMNNATNYDCEAFLILEDSIHLFSKNWLDFKTRHYVMPNTPGEHIAELRDSLDVFGQITAADINVEGEIVLLGYNVATGATFLWLLFDYQGHSLFSGNKRRIAAGNALTVSQVEGLAFSNGSEGYICSEKFSLLNPKLLKFEISQWTENIVDDVFATESTLELSCFPNPFTNQIHLKIGEQAIDIKNIRLIDSVGNEIKEFYQKGNFQNYILSLSVQQLNLPKGAYFLEVNSNDGKVVFPLLKG